MLDRLTTWLGPRIPAGVRRPLRKAAPLILAAVLFAAIGAAWPLSGSPPPPAPPGPLEISAATSAHTEGLDGFLAMTRWGTPPYDPERARREEEERRRLAGQQGGINPELAKLGVIGITSVASRHAVRLRKSGGAIVRLVDGDTLPDGRVLVSVAANSLVLQDAQGEPEELHLFSRVGEPLAADEPPADAEAVP
ncbi:MAG: hypothetical protein OXK76_05510 [Gammaproteobacteria bacterium]|nr:hypothetical protein [Gammaproteobacteria bacterium]